MSQALSQVLGQHMRLEQRLTPQLIQSMDILQLSSQDLEARLAEELEKNVTLEVVDRGDRPAEQPTADPDQRATPESDSFSRLDRFSRDNELEYDDRVSSPGRSVRSYSGVRDAKLDAMANTASRPEGIDEHLMHQWNLLDLDEDVRRAGEGIIYHLEEDGYLKTPLEVVAEDVRPPVPVEVVAKALELVQQLDPIGIAARTYRECLLLQLANLPGDNTIERELIERHLDDVIRNRYPAIAKATGYSVGEISAAVDAIRHSLVLQPAYLVVDRSAPRIYPDVVVEADERGAGFVVRLVRGNVPEVRVKSEFVDMIKSKENGKEVREFVRKQLESGNALVEAIKFRTSRLLEVAESVVKYQAEFFEIGPPGLRVLRMSDLAEVLECDPSTISRTVSEKYMQTPHGIFPLRYFFTGGTESNNGEGKSWGSIKTRVADIVKHEDPAKPLNDDQIVEVLQKEGVEISRRTVAKYRSQLDIPSARQRKKF